MAINKVELGNETLIDLTSDTVTEDDVLEGKTFHSADGEQKTGKVVVAPIDDTLSNTSTNPVQNKVITNELNSVEDKVDSIYEDGFASRNQLDMNNHIANAFINGSNGVITSSSGTDTYWMKCKRNTTYTVSRDKGNRTIIGGCTYEPKVGDTLSIIYNKGTFENPISFNSGNNDYIVFFGNSNADNKATWIQIEEGSDATAYTPYADSNVELTEKVNDVYDRGFASRNLINWNNHVYLVKGTQRTGNFFYNEITLKKGTYTISFPDVKIENQPSTASYTWGISFRPKNSTENLFQITMKYGVNSFVVTIDNDITIGRAYIFIGQNDRDECTVEFSLMQIERGSEVTPYQPYAKSNVELTEELAKADTLLSPVKVSADIGVMSGGYMRIGNIVTLMLTLTVSAQINANTVLVNALPRTIDNANVPILCESNTAVFAARLLGKNLYNGVVLPIGTYYISGSYLTQE